jgi:hypothetical protein
VRRFDLNSGAGTATEPIDPAPVTD